MNPVKASKLQHTLGDPGNQQQDWMAEDGPGLLEPVALVLR